jgi:metaxin
MSSDAATPRIVLLQFGPHPNFAPLPTFDPHCLIAQTYMRFARVPYIENNCNNPSSSPINKLPVLAINEVKTVVHTDIIEELASMGYDLDAKLTEQEKCEVEAWSSLVQHRLHNAQLYNWWAESGNYDEVTSMVFSRTLPFPLNFYLPSRFKKGVLAQLNSAGYTDSRVAYEEAAKCYKALSQRLGTGKYFFGDEPTSLDAVVFAFLATQFIPELPERKMHFLLSQHQNLIEYINNILSTSFSVTKPIVADVEPAQKWLKALEAEKAAREAKLFEESGGAPSSWDSSAAFSIAFGIGATVLYLASQNIQFMILTKWLSARLGSGSKKTKESVSYTKEQEAERAKWFGSPQQVEEEQIDSSDFMLTDDPDVNPMRSVHRFAPEDDAIHYIGDDGKAYDWDEQYLEEMETGSDIPEDHEDLGEEDNDDDEYD